MTIALRNWVPAECEALVQAIATDTGAASSADILARIEDLAERNRDIHERECFNLNPATNAMNPRAEALLATGLGSRPSLGYPGDKYEMGLEAIEEIEVIAAELAAEVFDAQLRRDPRRLGRDRQSLRLHGDLQAGRHDHRPGLRDRRSCHPSRGGLRRALRAAHRPGPGRMRTATPSTWTRCANWQRRERPRLITIGGSLNLFEHPVAARCAPIADEVGALVLFDAAHQCGIIAGKAWSDPLAEGAHLMTMSTYKSLGGPAGGLIVTNEDDIARRLDAIAFPGMTANFDAAKSAALAVTMLDWRDFGRDYASAMIALSVALAEELDARGVPVFAAARGFTASHQFAIRAADYGGGQTASKTLRKAGFLACGIGLPIAEVQGDLNGLRIGTPELVRWGLTTADADRLADLIARALTSDDPAAMLPEVSAWRQSFDRIHFVH